MYKKDNYKSKNSLLENYIEQINTLQKLVDFVYKS
jgi:hypothetical protein